MSHATQATSANAQAMHPQNTGENAYNEKDSTHNDSMLQIANIFMNKTASMSFLELQGANGRKFHFGENTMKQILLPEHTSQNQNTSSFANNLLKRIHLQKIFIQPGVFVCVYPYTQSTCVLLPNSRICLCRRSKLIAGNRCVENVRTDTKH